MKKYLYMMLLPFVAAACSETGDIAPVDDGSMKFEAIHPNAVTRVADNSFEAGDSIGLFVVEYDGESPRPLQISGNWANNVATVFSASGWTPEKKIFWSENKVDVYGYYPYMPLVSVDEQPFSVSLDQRASASGDAPGGYEASDFLWAKTAAASEEDGTVSLAFRHCMSKLVVQLVKGPNYEGDFPDNAEMFLHGTVPSARIDLVNGVVVKDMFGQTESIRMRKVDDGTYEAIVVPQKVDTRQPFVEMVVDGISYLLENTFTFKAGMVHTLSLTINSNPGQIEIEIGGSVGGGWN